MPARCAILAVLAAALAAPARAQDRQPPRVVSLPDIERPDEVDADRIEVQVQVHLDGSATLEVCEHPAPVCDLVREALAEARFESARVDGEPVVARVGLAFRLTDAPIRVPDLPPPPANPFLDPRRAELGVTAVAERATETPTGHAFELERAREIPGTLGDPFRAATLAPGVTPFISLLPFFYLRGAPITGTVYYYDGIPLPAIYHVAAGPAVIHPRMVGNIEVIPGIAPARYGRHSGGVVVGAGPSDAPPEDVEVEAALRLLDVNAYVRAPLAGGSVAVSGRFGYPGLIARAVDPTVQIDYGDYALRLDLPTARGERFQFVWVGSYDHLDMRGGSVRVSDQIELASELSFHRGELRYLLRRDDAEVGVALRGGYDFSELPEVVRLEAASFGPRFWLRLTEGPVTVRAGGDFIATVGELEQQSALITDRPPFVYYAEARRRATMGLYAELDWRPLPELDVSGGVRGDLWVTGPYYEGAVDPRLRATWHVTDAVDVHAAAGVARMPAVFLLPLPGLSELPLRDGLQTAVQSEVGVQVRGRTELGRTRAAARGFFHHYDGLMFTDLTAALDDEEEEACDRTAETPFCRGYAAEFRAEGYAYGLELDLRTDLGPHLWLIFTYTLSETEVSALGADVPFTPSYDVRHVFNAALSYDSRDGFTAGVRAFVRSGEVDGFVHGGEDLRLAYYEQRMPWFTRFDVAAAYAWDAGWARLRVGLEWINVLFFLGGEPLSIDCPSEDAPPMMACGVNEQPPLFLPNLSLRGTL